MVITTSPRFESEIQNIFDFIAKDSKERAKKIRKEISAIIFWYFLTSAEKKMISAVS